jgi:hypothetical protein
MWILQRISTIAALESNFQERFRVGELRRVTWIVTNRSGRFYLPISPAIYCGHRAVHYFTVFLGFAGVHLLSQLG